MKKTSTLLMIDDNQIYLELLNEVLEDSVINVLSTSDPHEGLRTIMVNTKLDIILLDIDMPGLNGIEILKQIRSLNRMNNIPVFIMSAREDQATILQLQALGVKEYLLKPFALDQLILRLKHYLGRDIFERNIFQTFDRTHLKDNK